MYLSHLEIKNFRNFKHLILDLTPTTVIVGENKVGKSNLIYALRLVLDPSLPDSYRCLHTEDFWDGLSSTFRGNCIEVTVEISGFDSNMEAIAVLDDHLVSIDPRVARLTYQFRPRDSMKTDDSREDDYEFVIFGGGKPQNRVGNDVRQWVSLLLLPALRDAESELQNWRRSPLRPLLERLEIEPDHLEGILLNISSATDALLAEKPIQDLTKEITDRVIEMVGESHSMDAHLGIVSTRSDQILRSIRIFIDGEKSRPLSQASLGTANILYLGLLLQDLEVRERLKKTVSTILAIEEPEAHLHPHIQRLVFRYFLRKNSPLIVTTHSPHIASVTPLNSLAVVRHFSKNGSKAFNIQNLKLDQNHIADLERYLDVTRAELLFSKGVILVEGPAELFLIPAFATGMGLSLDQLGITVCSVHGTDFSPYWILLSREGLDIPCVVITDGDPTTKNGHTRYLGIQRGLMLSQSADMGNSGQNWGSNPSKNRKLLAVQGIFVGEDTLEIDLLVNFANEIHQTYSDFGVSAKILSHFKNEIEAALTEDEQAKERVLARIERVGKGRFAQRLASKLNTSEPPAYIRDAITNIVDQVKRNERFNH